MNDEDHAKIVSNILGNKQHIGLTLPTTRASLGEIYRRYSFPAISGKVERVRSNKCTDFASRLEFTGGGHFRNNRSITGTAMGGFPATCTRECVYLGSKHSRKPIHSMAGRAPSF